MKKGRQILIVYCFFIAGIHQLHAQQGIVACGGDISGNGGSISYTIGQIDYTFLLGNGGYINQGIQQPHDNLTTSLKESTDTISASVSPNPTTDLIVLNVNANEQQISYSLCDERGRIIATQRISGTQAFISTDELASGYYFIKLYSDKGNLKIFKIIRQ